MKERPPAKGAAQTPLHHQRVAAELPAAVDPYSKNRAEARREKERRRFAP